MRHVWILSLVCCLLLITGCLEGTEKEKEIVEEVVTEPEANEADESVGARAYLQGYIDRLLGGDETVKIKVLGFMGADFGSFNSIEIISCRQKYSETGEKVDGTFLIQMHVIGIDQYSGKRIDKIFERLLMATGSDYLIM